MERQAITGTYVLHEHTFSCQAWVLNEKRFPRPGRYRLAVRNEDDE